MKLIKNNKLKMIVLSTPFFFLVSANSAKALIPVVDGGAITQTTMQTFQQMTNFTKEMVMQVKQMAQDKLLSGKTMSNNFKSSLMQTGAITDTQTNLYNKQSTLDLQPNRKEACVAIALNKQYSKSKSESDNRKETVMSDIISKTIPKAGAETDPDINGIPSVKKFKINMFDNRLKKIDQKYSSSKASPYLNPEYLFKPDMNSDDYYIAQTQIQLLAGEPEDRFDFNSKDLNNNDMYKQAYVDKAKKVIQRNMALNALENIVEYRKQDGSGNASAFSANQAFIDTTIKNADWVKKFTNTDKNNNNLTTTSQVIRESLRIDAQRLAIQAQSNYELEQIKSLIALQTLMDIKK